MIRFHYVNGFLITPDTQQVLLLEKQRPAFQHLKWNGIGGKIEAGEAPIEAMVREFYEEAGVITVGDDWTHALSLWGSDFVVHYYRSFVDAFPAYRQVTDEALGLFELKEIYSGDVPTLDNLRWILPLMFSTGVHLPLSATWVGTDPAHLPQRMTS